MLLDTQVLLWLRLGSARLGRRARLEIEQAWQSDEIGVSAITFWKVAMLRDKGRIRFPEDIGLWRKPESTEGGRRVSVLKRQEGVPVNLG